MEVTTIDGLEQTFCFLVAAETIPDDQQGAPEMLAQALDKGEDIVSGDVVSRDRKIQSEALMQGRDGDSAIDGQTVMPGPTVVNRRVAFGGPGSPDGGLEHETRLIDEDEGATLTPGFFLSGATCACASRQWRPHCVHGRGVQAFVDSNVGAASDARRPRGNR